LVHVDIFRQHMEKLLGLIHNTGEFM